MNDLYLKPIRLLTDRHQSEGVDRGAIGVVVDVWGDGFYEVEFSNPATGETIALSTLPESAIEPFERTGAVRQAQAGD